MKRLLPLELGPTVRVRMSLDKAIAHGKEKRKPYRGSKRIDHSCRNHGSCGYCLGNRTHQGKRNVPADLFEQLREALQDAIDGYTAKIDKDAKNDRLYSMEEVFGRER
jgi:hypothetical protein